MTRNIINATATGVAREAATPPENTIPTPHPTSSEPETITKRDVLQMSEFMDLIADLATANAAVVKANVDLTKANSELTQVALERGGKLEKLQQEIAELVQTREKDAGIREQKMIQEREEHEEKMRLLRIAHSEELVLKDEKLAALTEELADTDEAAGRMKQTLE
ncbi:hypothetical protein LTS18_012385 [Coniosporium uncinatum]|uniref:Uncharacterized protein n=1 Tax=Coniosporium uncinatum TaxID=93489 RepID=A0ACC3DVX7_9PEZI|nr:hypothetical protein LTS18_012385 [Coniosporium uncinatum]